MTRAAEHSNDWRRVYLAAALSLALLALGTRHVDAQMAGSRPPGPAPGAMSAPRRLPQFRSEAGPPVVEVQVVGNQRINTEEILSAIQTCVGRRFRASTLRDDVKRLMAKSWFYDVRTETHETDQGLIVRFEVVERPTILSVEFIGNKKIKDKKLTEITGLKDGGPMDPGLNRAATRRVEKEYRDKGYPFAAVELVEGGRRGDSRVVMKITEGPKTKINSITFDGNGFVSDARLRTQITSKRHIFWIGGKYDPESVDEDVQKLRSYYRSNGYLDMKVTRELNWNDERDRVQLKYIIDEGPRYTVRDINFAGNQAFDRVELAEPLTLASGEYFNEKALKADQQKVNDAYGKKGYINTLVNADVRYLDQPGEVDVVYRVKEDFPRKIGRINIAGNEVTKSRVIRSRLELAPGELADTTKLRESQQRLIESRLFMTEPGQGIMPTVEFDPTNDPDSPFQDLLVNVREGQTGSLLFGVGVNSDSGLGGSLVLHERNFDIFRLPTSPSDMVSGHAFRGAGQEFRLELVPGTSVHRYSVTFREPKLFGLDYSLSTSAYFYRRLYSNYDEERIGARFTLGKRFTREIGASITYRLENVEISDPTYPGKVPDIDDVVGDSVLASFRFAVDHDTRDSHLNPGKGHFIELGYEQALGDYNFPKVTLEGRQFWTLHKRQDGSGKHVLSARGEIGYAGSDTPIFERFFAGGFSTMRGFDYRGVSPVIDVWDSGTYLGDVEVGGEFMALTSLEYQFPLTADDNLHWVFFADGGTVQRDLSAHPYRVSVGFGLRVSMPAMGPVPLAFDFGFPVVKGDRDDTEVFSFSMGWFH